MKTGDEFFLFESLVVLRAARQGAPEDWLVFMGALSSESLVAQAPAPWERYTENFVRYVRVRLFSQHIAVRAGMARFLVGAISCIPAAEAAW